MDEFQNFTTETIASILSEARKYKLNLTVAHQFIKQLDERIRDAVFGNVGACFFKIHTLPAERDNPRIVEPLKKIAKLKYGRTRKLVEGEILQRPKIGNI